MNDKNITHSGPTFLLLDGTPVEEASKEQIKLCMIELNELALKEIINPYGRPVYIAYFNSFRELLELELENREIS